MDLHACLDEAVTIPAGGRRTVPTGIAIQLDPGYVCLLFGRSSLGVKHGILPANAVGVVDSVDDAAAHISAHSTGHSDCIVTACRETAERFIALVDSAAVYWNVSTRFTDGGEFGLGCEMGISTQKLHARGPMGLEELCSYKYVITGNGQIR